MLLAQALALPAEGGAVSLVGAGGKTSLMLRLGRELAGDGTRVVVTTTTHIMAPAASEVDLVLIDGRVESLSAALRTHALVCAACPCPDGKLSAPPVDLLRTAVREARWLLVEADGARRHPVKIPADHEPQIYEPSAAVVAVAGLTALGRPLREVCHRFERAESAFPGVSPDTLLTPGLLARMLTSGRGQFKHVGNAARFRVLLNQADDARLTALGVETAGHILRLLPVCRVVVGAMRQQNCVREVLSCSSL